MNPRRMPATIITAPPRMPLPSQARTLALLGGGVSVCTGMLGAENDVLLGRSFGVELAPGLEIVLGTVNVLLG